MLVRDLPGSLSVRDYAKREIDLRLVPWDIVADTRDGPEMWLRGAFADVDPTTVRLRMDHQNPAAGKGIAIEERDDAAYMTFRVSKTQRGDEILELASDGVTDGVSIGFVDVPGGVETRTVNGRRTRAMRRADLREASTTWMPTWEQSAVVAMRSAAEGDPVPEVIESTAVVPFDYSAFMDAQTRASDKLVDRLEKLEERSRADILIPARAEKGFDRDLRGRWMQAAVTRLAGDRVPEIELRELADLITSDNLGVVPDAFLSGQQIGVIDASRPFLDSTLTLALPAAGMNLTIPVIATRPTSGVQAAEKDPIASTTTSITATDFPAVTIAGGGDISIQLLRRSSPEYLGLYLDLLRESISKNAEAEAIAAILAAAGLHDGGTIDPEAMALGAAWGFGAAVGKAPNTIWLSSAGVGAFIDAKATGTNMPLYGTIQGGFSAANGAGGTIQGLRPVHVPALDATAVDALVGPSTGFAHTEDGTFTLQADNPTLAGRDVALVTIMWFAPLYPAAFTKFALGA